MTRYYEKKSNQVYVFASAEDKQAVQQELFFSSSSFLKQAKKTGEETYLAESVPLSPVLDGIPFYPTPMLPKREKLFG